MATTPPPAEQSASKAASPTPHRTAEPPPPAEGGYTLGVKNGQRPPSPHTRFSRLIVLAALALVPATAAAQGAAPDPAVQKLKAAAEKAVADAQQKRARKPLPAAPVKVDKATEKAAKDAEKAEKKEAEKKGAAAEERALRGVVSIERGGQVLGLGAVLAGDGRVLSALSPLGHGNDLEARFADNTVVRVKLGHHDRAWDLALLVPQSGRWVDGLTASSEEPVRPDASIHAFTAKAGKIVSTAMVLRSHKVLIGGDDKSLDNAIELGSRVSPADLGSPIIDETGRVVAIVGRGCAPTEGKPCTPVAFGAPIAAVKSFLRNVPAAAVAPPAWLGIQGVSETGQVAKGVRVLVVHPESPADEAHLKGGDRSVSDMILAVAGIPVTTPEQLAEVIRNHGIGEKVPILVFGQGKYREVTTVLRAAPDARAASAAPAAHPAELPALPSDK